MTDPRTIKLLRNAGHPEAADLLENVAAAYAANPAPDPEPEPAAPATEDEIRRAAGEDLLAGLFGTKPETP